MPNSASRARARQPITAITRADSVTSASAVMLGLSTPNTSGIKPVESDWNVFGNGPIFCPASSHIVAPRNTSIPASVTMNDGTRQ